MRILSRVMVGLVLAFSLGVLALGFGAPPEALESRNSLVSLWYMDDGQPAFICSGGVVDFGKGKRRVVTAAHCMEGEAKAFRIRTPDGKMHPLLSIEKMDDSEPEDFAVLRSTAAYAAPALGIGDVPTPGDAVYVWHHALGFQALFSTGEFQGKIVSLDGDDYFTPVWGMLKTSLEVGPGASGSLAVNADGEAIGIVSRRLPAERFGMGGSILSPMPK